jgi:hypothetical protein
MDALVALGVLSDPPPLVNPMARNWLLDMARRRCGSRYMVGWSEDHVAAIGSLNLNFGLLGGILLNWRPGDTLRWKAETAGWDGREV